MRNRINHFFMILVFVFMSGFTTTILATPQINLIPISVQSSFKKAEQATLAMQRNTRGIMTEMDLMGKLYVESKCDSISGDQGCYQLKNQMRLKFMALNSELNKSLPAMKNAVFNAHKIMGSELKRIGSRYSPSEIIKLNHEASKRNRKSRRAITGKNPFNRMASMFRKLNQSVGGSQQTNLFILASQTYGGLGMIKEELALLERHIANNRILDSLSMTFTDFPVDDLITVSHVRNVIFGDSEDPFSGAPVYQPETLIESYEDRLEQYY